MHSAKELDSHEINVNTAAKAKLTDNDLEEILKLMNDQKKSINVLQESVASNAR